jgi:hypothetical protein
LSGLQAFCTPRNDAVTVGDITDDFDQLAEADSCTALSVIPMACPDYTVN